MYVFKLRKVHEIAQLLVNFAQSTYSEKERISFRHKQWKVIRLFSMSILTCPIESLISKKGVVRIGRTKGATRFTPGLRSVKLFYQCGL